MRQLLVAGAFVIFCSQAPVLAAENNSTANESDETKVSRAVKLLDEWRGDRSLLEHARTELESVLKRNARYAPAHREMARYYMMSGYISYEDFTPKSLELADSSINKAIEINAKYADAFVLRGYLYRLMHRHREAVAALETAEKLGTTDPWLQLNWAALLIDEGQYEKAAQRYKKVIESNTPNKKAMAGALAGLTEYYEKVGNHDQVDRTYRKQIELEPNNAWSYGNYARYVLCKGDDYEKSIQLSRQAVGIMDYGMGRYWLAAALYRKWAQGLLNGSPNSGTQYFLEAQSLYPDADGIAADARNCPPLLRVGNMLIYARSKGTYPARQGPSAGARP